MKLTPQLQQEIDAMDLEEVLTLNRHGENDAIWEGESGKYAMEHIYRQRSKVGEAAWKRISLTVGWPK